VLDTYFVFLRASVLTGQLTLEKEQEIVKRGLAWLHEHAAQRPVYRQYLNNCGMWSNPWKRELEPSPVA
jgi:hypothetical protein